jgi:hypothetical protein
VAGDDGVCGVVVGDGWVVGDGRVVVGGAVTVNFLVVSLHILEAVSASGPGLEFFGTVRLVSNELPVMSTVLESKVLSHDSLMELGESPALNRDLGARWTAERIQFQNSTVLIIRGLFGSKGETVSWDKEEIHQDAQRRAPSREQVSPSRH